jgi:hypothetical protein
MERKPRRSRFRFDGPDADDKALVITERDIAILKLLDPEHRYTYLPSHWIHAFIGGEQLRLSKRLGRLSRAPHQLLYRPAQRAHSLNANYKHDVYARADAGDRLLIERSLLARRASRPTEAYAHQVLNDLVDASIEIGVRADPALRLIGWKEILAHPKLPDTTKQATHPFRISVAGTTLIPDGRPFVLERTLADGAKRYLCVAGKEIDRHTEPLVPADLDRSGIARKLALYRDFFSERIYHRHYGFPNAVVLIISTNARHLENIMALTRKLLGPCSFLLFRPVPDWAHARRFPPPNGDMLGIYHRVGHPPLNLATLGEL